MDFVNQLLDAVISLFSIHYAEPRSGIEMPPVAEATWHGACLGCAEFARRGLVRGAHTGQLINWMLKVGFISCRYFVYSTSHSLDLGIVLRCPKGSTFSGFQCEGCSLLCTMVLSKGTGHGRLAPLCFGSRAGFGRNERLR